jgi:hypothetical protein
MKETKGRREGWKGDAGTKSKEGEMKKRKMQEKKMKDRR